MTGAIHLHASLEAFFEELLCEALSQNHVDLDDLSRQYLVQLFAEIGTHADFLVGDRTDEPGTPGLVWLYERTQTTGSGARFDAYRHLGDVALVVSGFFAPHIERPRSLVGTSYYVDMGRAAYGSAAALARTNGFGHLLSELSTRFRDLVEVLGHMAEQTTLPAVRDVGSLYERFLQRPSSRALQEQMVLKGLIPATGVSGDWS